MSRIKSHRGMNIKKTVFSLLAASTVLTTAVCLLSEQRLVDSQSSTALRSNMKSLMDSAETARQAAAALRRENAFDDARLVENAKKHSSFRDSTLYKTVPVVAAWNSVGSLAKQQGYDFRVPANDPRDPRNEPTAGEARILQWLEANRGKDYFEEDTGRQEAIYARAVILSEDCLVCHGHPSRSKTDDGKDPLGFPMENWKPGDMHGAFLLRASTAPFIAAKRRSMMESAGLLLLSALVIGLALHLLWRRVQRQLDSNVGTIRAQSAELSTMVSALTGEAGALARASAQQSASIEENSAAMEEIRGVAQQNRRAAADAASSIGACKSHASLASSSLGDLAAAMNEINDSTGRIAKIIRLMDEIAFQTNILALNAAVEAARAGQAGQGFSVVADEVRSLAHRSTQAAKEIQSIIEESVTRARNADEVSHAVSAAIGKMNTAIQHLAGIVQHVEGASQEQARGIDEMSNALHGISNLTSTVTGAAHASQERAEQLGAQSEQLNGAATSLERLLA
jgi:methyl-accepting chemotaxis protein